MKINFFSKIQITILSLIFVFLFSFLFPQKAYAADITIDAASILATSHGNRSMVFTAPLKGYFFFVDSDSDFKYMTTTDGGATWGGTTTIYTGTVQDHDVWFDQWTPGDDGTIIHTWYIESGTDDVRYRQLDTANNQLATEVVVAAQASAATGRGTFVSGAKARGGNLLVAFDIDAGAEIGTYRSINGGKTWIQRTNMVEATIDQLLMFPGNEADSQDMWALYHDASADALTLKVHDDSADTNSESSAIVTLTENTTDGTGQYGFTGSIRHSDGHLLVGTFSAYDGAGNDFQTWDINGTASITEKTAITTNIDDMYHPSIFIDQTTDDVYMSYIGKRDGSETIGTSTGVYYTKSTDDMATWSAGDTAYSAAASDYRQTWSPLMGNRFMVAYRDLSDQALYTNYDNSVSIGSATTYCSSQVASGNWNTAATWDCGHVPTTGENVIIDSGDTITMDVNSAVLGSITIIGTLNTSDGTSRTLSGTTMNITSTGTLTANASVITLTGDWSNVNGTFTQGTSNVTFSGTSIQTITTGGTSSTKAFYDLTINKASNTIYNTADNLSVLNDFTLTSGTFVATSGTMSVTGDFSDNGGTFTHNSGNVLLASTSNNRALTVQNGVTTFNNIGINDSGRLGAYWKMDEANAGDDVVDSTGNANTGTTPNGDPTPSASVPTVGFTNNYSLDFDGTDDYVRVPYSSHINTNSVSAFTLSIWASRDDTGDAALMSQFGAGLYQGWMIWRQASTTQYKFYVNGTARTAITTSGVGVWQHVAVVWDGTNAKMYSDGTLIQTVASPAPNNPSADIILGAYYNNGPSSGGGVPTWRWNGKLDDARVYNYALSDAEVADLAAGDEYFTPTVGTVTQTSGSLLADGDVTLTAGTYSTGNNNVSTDRLVMLGGTFNAGSSTIALTSTGTVFDYRAGTFSAGTSGIRLTDSSATAKTFAGGGQTFNNVWLKGASGGGSYTISGNNTFADFKDDGAIAHSIYFTTGSTQTVATFTVNGVAGQLIAIDSTTTGTHALVSTGSNISVDYVSVQHSVASGTGTWTAGANSTDNNAVPTAGSGWNFGGVVTCISQATGNWNTTGTWDCGIVPTTNTRVNIAAGHTVTMDVASAVLDTITINGTLTTSNGTSWALSGVSVDITSTGTLTANASTITLSGTTSNLFTKHATGTFTSGTSTVVLSGNGDATVNSGTVTFYYLTSSGTGTKTLGANVIVSKDLTISAGTFALSTYDITVTGTTSITGTLNDASATGTNIFTDMVTVNNGGTWSNTNNPAYTFRGGLTVNTASTFSSGSGVYTFDTNAQTISGTQAFTITSLTNSLTSGNGLTFSTNNPTVTTLTQSTNAVLTFSGTVPTITTLTATASPNTVQYTGGTQTVKGTTYHHLIINGTDTKTLGAATVVNGDLTITAGTLALSTFDTTVTGATSVTGTLNDASATGTNIFVGAVTVNNGGTWSNSNNPGFTFRGGLTVNTASTFSSGSGTYTFNTNAQSIGGTQAFTITALNNDITSSTGLSFASNNPTVTTLTQGTNAVLTFSGTVPTITTLTATASPNTVQYTGGTQTVKGTTYHHVIINGTDTKTLGATTAINGDLTITASTLQISTLSLTVTGATSVTGTIDDSSSTGTNIFVGAITINNGGTWTSTGNEDYALRGGLTVNSTSTFTSGSGVYTFETNAQSIGGTQAFTIASITNNVTSGTGLTFSSNNPTVSNVLWQGTDAVLTFAGTVPTVNSILSNLGANTVVYSGADQTIISNNTYYNLTISGSGTKTASALIYMDNNLVVSAGTLQIGTGNIAVTGTTSITGAFDDSSATGTNTFTGAVTLNSGSTWTSTGGDGYTFLGGLTVNTASTFTSGTGVYAFTTNAQSIGGTQAFTITNLTNSITTGNGLTFSSNNPTVTTLTQSANAILTFAGTVPTITTLSASATDNLVQFTGADQTIPSTTYNDILINGTGTKTFADSSTINDDLTITASTLQIGTASMTVFGDTSITGTIDDNSTSGSNIFTGPVVVNSGGTWTSTGNDGYTFRGGLTVNTSSTFTSGSGTYTFATNAQSIGGTQAFTITALTNSITAGDGLTFASNNPTVTTLTQGTSAVLTFSGTVPTITTLTATASPNTVQYTGATQTIKGTTYHHLTLSGSGTDSLGASATVNGTLTVGGSVTLDPTSSYTFTGSGTNVLDVTGVIKVQHSTFAGSYISFETVTLNSGSTVNYALDGAQTVDGTFDYYNLTISGGNTKTASEAFALASNGTLTVSAGTFDPDTYLVTGTGTNTVTVANGATLKVGASTFAGSYSAGFTTRTLSTGSTLNYSRSGDQTIDSTLSMSNMTISGSGTKSLNGTTTVSTTTTVSAGTLDMTTSNYALNTSSFILAGGTVLARGSVISLTGTGTVFTYSSGTFTPATSTLRLTDSSASAKTFAGGGQTYNNIHFDGATGTGSYTISGSNTFNEFKDTGNIAHSILFTAGTTTTISDWRVVGRAGHLISLNSTTPTSKWYLVNTNNGYTIASNYVSLRDSEVTSPTSTYAGIDSVDDTTGGSTNVGWIFNVVRSQGGGTGNLESGATPDAQVGGGGAGGGEGLEGGGNPDPGVGGGGAGGGDDLGFYIFKHLFAFLHPNNFYNNS